MDYSAYFQLINLSQPIWIYIFFVIAFIIFILNKFNISNLIDYFNFKYTYRHTHYMIISDVADLRNDFRNKNTKIFTKLYYLSIVGLLFISLAEPFYLGEKLPDPPSNRNIVFLVDNEVSMVLKDYFIDEKRVDRLTMVKSVLLNFANKLSGNRISIITFSEEAHTLLPFTTDTKLIKSMIPRIDATLTGRTSNPQKAMLYTLNYLQNLGPNISNEKPSIILITDVLRPPRDIDPNIVAKYIKQKGYKLFVIAIGASSYNATDIQNSTLIYHPASFERLQSIAKSANGKFYWAKNTNSLSEVIQEVLKSKEIQIKVNPSYIKVPLFQWPLALALIFVLIQYIISQIPLRNNSA